MSVAFNQNGIKVEDKGDTLCITIDKNSDLGLSASGKSRMVASTRGNVNIGDLTIGVNAYRKP